MACFVLISGGGKNSLQNKELQSNCLPPSSLPPSLPDCPLSSDLWLLNSCTVKGPAEDSLKSAIRKGRELGKPLVVSGCVPQGQKNHSDILGLSVVGVSEVVFITVHMMSLIVLLFLGTAD